MSSYKYCFVPQCTNTTSKTPSKIFFSVPKEVRTRSKWCQAARRDDYQSATTSRFCCEDHFNLEEDVKDYTRYKFLKSAGMATFRLSLKPGVLPHIFDCQSDRKRCHTKPSRTVVQKLNLATLTRKPLAEVQNILPNEMVHSACQHEEMEIEQLNDVPLPPIVNIMEEMKKDAACQTDWPIPNLNCQATKNAACQVNMKPLRPIMRSFGIQVKPNTKDAETSPIKFRNRYGPSETKEDAHNISIDSVPENISDVSYQPDETEEEQDEEASSEDEVAKQCHREEMQALSLQVTEYHIYRNPRLYLGLDAERMGILDQLEQVGGVDKFSLLVVLRKIRLNESLDQLADAFGCSKAKLSRIISQKLGIISKFLSVFVFWPEREITKRMVPVPFRLNFAKVESILDCFEIEIEKPSDSVWQALTWSSYKHCNTVKYLISSTPNGFINYISKGYGGRASDIVIIENCGYLDLLKPGTYVMADRGFKSVESILNEKDCYLIRPPSVSEDSKMTEADVKRTRVIASLRIHIERVIRRLREFSMLSPHSCFHHSYLSLIDFAVVLVCGLCNLQGPLIL